MGQSLKILLRIEEIVATVAYAIVAALLLGEIIAREIFSTSIEGSQKMAVFAAVYAGFLGLSLATANNSHLRPQFTDGWWPQRLQPFAARFGDIFSAFLFIGIGYVATSHVMETFANEDRAAVLYWPLWPIQVVIPYAFFSSAVRHIAFGINPDLKPVPEITEG